MALVEISGGTGDAGAVGDNRPWKLWAAAYQSDGAGGVITTRDDRDANMLRPVKGVLTFKAEAGIAAYLGNPDGKRWLVTIPEANGDLWELIEAAVAYPPETSQAQLTAAVGPLVDDYLPEKLDEVVPEAVDADLESRDIGFVDEGGGEGHFTVGGVDVSGTLVPPAATWSGVAGKPNLVTNLQATKTITVGTGGDFATLNAALKEASRYSRDYISKGLTLEVKQLSGFVMAEQVFVVAQDLSFVTITSEDAEVTIQRSALTEDYPGGNAANWRDGVHPAFTAMRGAGLPLIKTLYNMDTSGTGYGTVGVYIFDNSRGTIFRDCGVKNAGWRGLYVDGSSCYARHTVWDGAGYCEGVEGPRAGLRASNSAVVMFRDASAKNCWNGADISMAHVQLAYTDFSNAGSGGGGAPGNGIISDASYLITAGTIANNCAGTGFQFRYGTILAGDGGATLPSLISSGCAGGAVAAYEGSVILAPYSTLSSTTARAVLATGGARVVLNNAVVSSTGGSAVEGTEGAEISVVAATLTGSTWGARMYASRLNAVNAKIGGTTGDVQLNDGSILQKQNAFKLDGVTALAVTTLTGSIVLGGGRATVANLSVDKINGTNGNPVLLLNDVTNGLNHLRVSNGVAGLGPTIAPYPGASDTTISLTISPYGIGGAVIFRDGAGAQICSLGGVASAVNRLTITNAISGSPVLVTATGTGDVGLNLVTLNAGLVLANGVEVLTAKRTINAQTGTSYTPVLADAGHLITLTNASAITLTVPANATAAFPVGTIIELAQLGAGQVTVAGAGGVTVNATPGLKISAQYGAARLVKLASNVWLLTGDLAA